MTDFIRLIARDVSKQSQRLNLLPFHMIFFDNITIGLMLAGFELSVEFLASHFIITPID